MAAYATSCKPLLSARSHAASSLKRRRHVADHTRNFNESNHLHLHLHHSLFQCVAVGDLNGRIRNSPKQRSSYSLLQHLIFPKALRSCDPYPHLVCLRQLSSIQESSHASAHESLEYRVSQLEHASALRRLTKYDVQHQIWPLLAECAPPSSYRSNNGAGRAIMMPNQQERLDRAKLSNRLLELCLKDVEARRLFLWEWLQKMDQSTNNKNNDAAKDEFSPTKFWNEAPRPTKEMFSLVISTWKHVIESCSSFSIKSLDAMDLMESSAQQASSILSLMEDEYVSDLGFIETYNSKIDKDSYTLLLPGAASPDVRNYSEAIGTWGQCIDGSALRLSSRSGRRNNTTSRDGAYQKRLQLEATAMKSMMKLLDFMEADLYAESSNDSTATSAKKKRPPPDRICYNIVLTSMARQVNPSLHEMRLVLQRMMERVQYELEYLDVETDLDEDHDEDHNERAMTFFPDVFSYNALIEARANLSAIFASDFNTKHGQQHQLLSPRVHVWQQANGEHELQRKRSFSSSEEEAIVAENILEEMRGIQTVSVRPNIWSYNAVIKAWLKTGTDRGLQRAIMLLCSLALNGKIRLTPYEHNNDMNATKSNNKTHYADNDGKQSTMLQRIVNWGTSILSKGSKVDSDDNKLSSPVPPIKNKTQAEKSEGKSQQILPGLEIESQLHAIYLKTQELKREKSRERPAGSQTREQNTLQMSYVSIGMSSRMALINSVVQGENEGKDVGTLNSESNSGKTEEEHDESYESIGPLPNIETGVSPDLKTFTLLVNALERRGTPTSAQLAEDLLHLLKEYYFNLNPDISITNSVLNAWAAAAKETSDARSSLASAQKADDLLHNLLGIDQQESDKISRPNEYTFLMTINAWANAASMALAEGNVSDGQVAAERLINLLTELREQPLRTSKTTLNCYGAAIRTLASIGDANRAQTVLEEMLQISGNLQLDLIPINALFNAWVRELASSKDEEKIMSRLSDMHDILMKMGSGGVYNVDPDTSSFNHVIRACYAPWTSTKKYDQDEDTRRKALEIAHDSYMRMSQAYDSTHTPDAHTYAHMFKAIACLAPNVEPFNQSEKYRYCRTILQACCRDGQLTKSSVWTLRKMFPAEDTFAELLISQMDQHHHHGSHNMNKEKLLSIPEDELHSCLPMEWSRNGRRFRGLNRHRQK